MKKGGKIMDEENEKRIEYLESHMDFHITELMRIIIH